MTHADGVSLRSHPVALVDPSRKSLIRSETNGDILIIELFITGDDGMLTLLDTWRNSRRFLLDFMIDFADFDRVMAEVSA